MKHLTALLSLTASLSAQSSPPRLCDSTLREASSRAMELALEQTKQFNPNGTAMTPAPIKLRGYYTNEIEIGELIKDAKLKGLRSITIGPLTCLCSTYYEKLVAKGYSVSYDKNCDPIANKYVNGFTLHNITISW